ncbi:MAG: patatin-like phospholipase family protein, partial [Bacteroidales bacterium]|nr:patatin-like phospholipase family protein [Bacteroidales bacterium]
MQVKKITATLLAVLISLTLHSQSVGLVLSGGGAKGLSHIGVIKALEENNIPIDYVAGTSMGAIVAGLYSIGLS